VIFFLSFKREICPKTAGHRWKFDIVPIRNLWDAIDIP